MSVTGMQFSINTVKNQRQARMKEHRELNKNRNMEDREIGRSLQPQTSSLAGG